MTTDDLEQSESGGQAVTPRRVLAVIAGALLIAVLLNASELEKDAKAKPFGNERDFWVAVWKPFATVSRALGLDKPREWADQALNRADDGSLFVLPAGTETPGSRPGSTSTPVATPTPEPKPALRAPTVEQPLRLWIGGDSVVKIVGEAVLRQGGESGLFDVTHEPQLQSGLTRPDFFDWPGELNRVSQAQPGYEVLVVMFGANDAQGIVEPNGTIHQTAGTPGWLAEYRRRVAGVMDLMKGGNRLVVWVGQPIMRSDELSQRMQEMNAIYADEAAKRPWVEYVDLWPLFATPQGGYDAYIKDDDGEVKLMRHPDGVHFVREGGERAARHILDFILQQAKP